MTYRGAQNLIKQGDEEGLRAALNGSLSSNLANPNGWTLLMLAAVEGHVALGKLLLENDKLTFARNEVSMFEQSKSAKLGFAKPGFSNLEIPFENAPAQHATIMQNFVDSILDHVPLIAPGEEGIHSIELANVVLYSGLTNQTIELPLDSAAYEKKLQELIASSKFEKKVAKVSNEDFAKSFMR